MRSRRLNRAALALVLGWIIFWLTLGALAGMLTGCTASEVRYVTAPLPLPARPLLPVVHEAEVSCLSTDTWRRLVERERLRREYAEQLETIITTSREAR